MVRDWADFGVWEEHRRDLLREAENRRLARGLREARAERRSEEASVGLPEGIEVRWGLLEDEPRIAEILELNGMPRWIAFEERYIVAEKDGEILAALRYRMASKKLLLGLFVADPWVGEHALARALYAGAGALAREIGVKEVLARAVPYRDYPREAGYHRWGRLWRLDVTRSPESFGELPASGWRRVLGLLSVVATPFFRIFPEKTL